MQLDQVFSKPIFGFLEIAREILKYRGLILLQVFEILFFCPFGKVDKPQSFRHEGCGVWGGLFSFTHEGGLIFNVKCGNQFVHEKYIRYSRRIV